MSYSRLGSALIGPQRATSSAKKPVLRVNPKLKLSLSPSAIKSKSVLVVGPSIPSAPKAPVVTAKPPPPVLFLPAPKPPVMSTPPPAAPPPADSTPKPPADVWSDWETGSPEMPAAAEQSVYEPPPPEVQEPSQAEPLVPAKPLPWAWIALGLTATALLGYAVFKRKPVSPNRRRRRRYRR